MSNNCSGIDIYADIKHCAGDINLPGTLPFFFMLRKANVTKWPKLPTLASTVKQEEVSVYNGNIQVAGDYKWVKVDMVPDSATFGSESQGNWGSKTFNNTATFVIPGTKEEVTGMITLLNNDNCIYLVPGRDGKCRLIGAEEFDATANLKQEQGAAAASDSAQTTIELSCTSKVSLPFYFGDIETADGTYKGDNCFAPTNA